MPDSFANRLKLRWLQGMFWPTLLLWLYAFAYAVASVWQPDGALSPNADYIASPDALFCPSAPDPASSPSGRGMR